MSALLAALALLAAAPAPVDPAAELAKGEALFREFKYAEAVKVLTRARAAPGLERPALLRVLELLGVAHGQLRQPERAEQAFLELLTLEPAHRLETEYAPRVMTPYFAAQQAAADRGPLAARSAVVVGAGVEAVGVTVDRDPGAMVRRVRFHLLEPVARTEERALSGTQVSLPVQGEAVRWWAELLSESGAQLLLLGSPVEPLLARAPRPEPRPAPPPPAPPAAAPAPAKLGAARVAALVSGGVAVAAGGVGAVFGLQSRASFDRLTTAPRSPGGVVVGLTEVEADALRRDGARQALLANVLFGVAGAAAVTGVVLWVVGAPPPPVVLVPGPGGVVLAGTWP